MWDSYCIYTPGLRVIFWFFLMTQKEQFTPQFTPPLAMQPRLRVRVCVRP
jgi:hypothetical protein